MQGQLTSGRLSSPCGSFNLWYFSACYLYYLMDEWIQPGIIFSSIWMKLNSELKTSFEHRIIQYQCKSSILLFKLNRYIFCETISEIWREILKFRNKKQNRHVMYECHLWGKTCDPAMNRCFFIVSKLFSSPSLLFPYQYATTHGFPWITLWPTLHADISSKIMLKALFRQEFYICYLMKICN